MKIGKMGSTPKNMPKDKGMHDMGKGHMMKDEEMKAMMPKGKAKKGK